MRIEISPKLIKKMGLFGSSEERIEEKVVDSTGQVNNNIVIQEAHDTHSQLLINEKLLWATYILIALEVIKLAVYLFTTYRKKLKKALQQNHNNNA